MPPTVALILSLFALGFLFYRDIKNHPSVSQAIWIPFTWFFLNGSKELSAWFALGNVQARSVEAYTEGNPFDRNFILLLIIFAIAVLLKRHVSIRAFISHNRVLFFFVLYCMISILWADFPYISLKRFIKFVGIFPMILIVYSERSPIEAISSLLRRCSYSLMLLSFLFVRFIPEYGRYYDRWTGRVFYSGVGGNKNDLGAICILATIIFTWELLRSLRENRAFLKSLDNWIYFFFLLITFYLAIIAQSSTSTMCIIISLLILIGTSVYKIRNNPQTIGVKILGTFCVLAILQIFFNIYELVVQALGRNPTLTGRTEAWPLLFKMGTNPIFGTGYESFWIGDRMSQLWSAIGLPIIQAHNGYIETFLNLGLIGVAFLLAFLFIYYRSAVSDIRNNFIFNQLKLTILFVFMFYNITEAAFPRVSLLFSIFFLFIIKMPLPEKENS